MHGRIKTRTTEEQEKIKKLEREKKAKAYKSAMSVVVDKRKSECFDQEGMDVTTSILTVAPDVITVWNYRREILLHMKEKMEEEEFQKVLEKDLTTTEQCLRVNPKSYGSWHHRIWVLKNMPSPDWEKELYLCKKYLELDERNFHCWDYRRTIVELAKVPDISEYEYTLEKIEKNFSNYSAWHLRSKLLQKIFPDQDKKLPIDEAKHKEELELVQNAAFTDPNDQSAWFYQKWLLGLTNPKIHFVVAEVQENKIFMALSHACNQLCNTNFNAYIKTEINGKEANGMWKSSSGEDQSTVWILHLDNVLTKDDEITLTLIEDESIRDKIEISILNLYQKAPNFMPPFSSSLQEVLMDELLSCEQLLELEPDSKWTILTSVQLMESIDANKYEKTIEKQLMNLMEVDPLRQGYYEDLFSKVVTESAIRKYFKSVTSKELNKSIFLINNKSLTCLYRMQYLLLVEELDLSCNNLTSTSLRNLHCLINCKKLNLDSNRIRHLEFLPILNKLEKLSLYNNPIEDSSSEHLEKFQNLKEIHM